MKTTANGMLGSMTIAQWEELEPVFAKLEEVPGFDAPQWTLPDWMHALRVSIMNQPVDEPRHRSVK